jgi:hypothetical protein
MNTPNFRQLYAQLDLQPGCTLDELRHAYRQRMMQLHPDKQTAPGSQADAGTPASDLNFIYASAIRFHREHGRLPGGRSPASTDQEPGREARRPSRPEAATAKMNATPAQEEGPTLRRGPMLLVLLLLSALALAIFLDAMPDPAPEPAGFFSQGK